MLSKVNFLNDSMKDLNRIFLTNKRGLIGNHLLESLISQNIPNDEKFYRLEFELKKKTKKLESLRVDAIIFSNDKKDNLAIDSKFPLDNYLLMNDEKKDSATRDKASKLFKNDLKRHIEKTASYISLEDGINHSIMFVPSDAIYLAINELKFYEIFKFAREMKVSICSPSTFHILIDQIISNRKYFSFDRESISEKYAKIDLEIQEIEKLFLNFEKKIESMNKQMLEIKKIISSLSRKRKEIR